jgi:hypothetical protein
MGVIAFFGTQYLKESAGVAQTNAQGIFDSTSTSVQQIAQEEETIVRYIGRYQQLESEGVMSAEDRLVLLENIGNLREQLHLYTMGVDMSEQVSTRLEYDPYDPNPGLPVDLHSFSIRLSLPLLHEEDLTRLIDGMLAESGLVLPRNCQMSIDAGNSPDFSVLGEHLAARCILQRYTFDLNPEVIVDAF